MFDASDEVDEVDAEDVDDVDDVEDAIEPRASGAARQARRPGLTDRSLPPGLPERRSTPVPCAGAAGRAGGVPLPSDRPHLDGWRLGVAVLPTSPAPGFGGSCSGDRRRSVPDMDLDLLDDLTRLTHQLEAGQRIPQPRLRHRFQADRVGLSGHRHRLVGTGEELRFEPTARHPALQVLGAVYAAARLDPEHRGAVFGAVRRGLRWRGEVGPRLVEHLSDERSTANWSTLGGRDPVVWALAVLGLPPDTAERALVQARFRELVRLAHPDHGGATDDAAQRINELTEARRILLHR
ncbi:MAG: hypothetical protein R2746_09750 [Acidimicrobiales bacterium]